MIKHIVMWNVKDGSDADVKTAIKAKLDALPGIIPGIREFEVGIDFNRSDAAWDVVLYSAFESREALDAYQNHPAHVEAAGFVKSAVSARAVADYVI